MLSYKCGGGYIHEIPNKDIEYVGYFYGKNGNESIKNAYTRIGKIRGRKPDILMNAELFNFKTRKPASDVVSNGVNMRLTEGYGMAFPDNKKAVFCYKNNVGAKEYLGAYPLLVKDGKKQSGVPAGIGGVRGRTAIGVSDDAVFLALIPDSVGVTLDALRRAFINAGAKHAINLDGGGSTQYYSPSGNYFTGRKVRGFVGVWLAKKAGTDIRTVKVRTSLNIRQTPSIFGKRVGSLKNGERVNVIEEKNGWCRIPKGWVYAAYLMR